MYPCVLRFFFVILIHQYTPIYTNNLAASNIIELSRHHQTSIHLSRSGSARALTSVQQKNYVKNLMLPDPNSTLSPIGCNHFFRDLQLDKKDSAREGFSRRVSEAKLPPWAPWAKQPYCGKTLSSNLGQLGRFLDVCERGLPFQIPCPTVEDLGWGHAGCPKQVGRYPECSNWSFVGHNAIRRALLNVDKYIDIRMVQASLVQDSLLSKMQGWQLAGWWFPLHVAWSETTRVFCSSRYATSTHIYRLIDLLLSAMLATLLRCMCFLLYSC